jgi:hypothetical protein
MFGDADATDEILLGSEVANMQEGCGVEEPVRDAASRGHNVSLWVQMAVPSGMRVGTPRKCFS